ncbi:MAG: aspartate-semialdehyde dehydrogenase [Deltaproteobacteria bacterium]|jgi:aspartate-semialdehyde dehydrogenase|nr:aspartate-semialdehyde dehydrogenase [Deltaproteobacteria bacterium]
MKQNIKIGIIGATGVIGREILSCFEERAFPVEPDNLRLFASEKSDGEIAQFGGAEITVEVLKEDSFKEIDLALFAVSDALSAKFVPLALAAGAIVIDTASQWRLDKNVLLTIPEVNSELLKNLIKLRRETTTTSDIIITSPNSAVVELAVILKPILDNYGLKRVVCSTYQSTSGVGQIAMDELWEQTRALYNQENITPQKFPYQIAFNCIPQTSEYLVDGYVTEEKQLIEETRKVLGLADLKITATTVQVPIFSCYAESVNIETENSFEIEEFKQALLESPGIIVLDNIVKKDYPMPIQLAGTDVVYVGRIRRDESVVNGVNLWIVADNLRKGSALNVVQIAEIVVDSL